MPDEPLTYSVASLAVAANLSPQTIRREINEGHLQAVRIRSRLVIPAAAVNDWLKAASRG